MEQRTYGKLEWVFYIIILPLLFTSLISGLVLQIMGYNVTGKLMSIARQTPVINSIVPPDEATKKERSEVNQLQDQLTESQKAFEQARQKVDSLQQSLTGKESELNKTKQALENTAKQNEDQKNADLYWKKQAKVYSEMSPKNAAAIIGEMPVNEARAILGRMSSDVKAAVLEKMDPKIAAVLETDLGNVQENGQQSAHDYVKTNPNVYALMSPDKAAAILELLSVEQARSILKSLDTQTKAAILEKMDPKKAAVLV